MDELDAYDAGFVAVGGLGDHDDIQHAVFQATPVPTVVVDLERRTVTVNAAFRRLFGFETEHITMAQLDGITHPEDRESLHELRRALGEDGIVVSVDKRYLRPDGSSFWGHLTAEPLVDPDGRRWGVIAAIADVTDRVEAEEALRESEQRFRALVQNATDAIVVLDHDGRLVYSSPSGERLTGNRLDDVVGSDTFQYVHPDDRDVVARLYTSIFESDEAVGPNVPLQFRVLHNDGSIRFVEAIATNLLDDPAVRGVVVNIRDLTDSAEAASALELTERRFRRMIENIADTVTLLDADGRVIQSTGNLKPMLGYPAGFWDDRSIFEVVHPDDLERMVESFASLRSAPGAQLSGELRVRASDGRWVDTEVDGVNLLHDPDVGAVVLTTRNISDRKRAERELNEARDQAVKALQMRTEFIASISHELRSPIHGVLGLSELLASAVVDADARQLVQSISRATETLRMVLDDILDYAKIEVGRLEIAPSPVRVAEIGDDLLALFAPEARAKGIRLTIDADERFPAMVRADGLRVRQVLTNLVGNAVKFTREGEVQVRATCSEPDAAGRARARIEVRDTGIGIPPDVRDRLFQPFSPAHTATAREFGGSGLGLSITKRLVELMGGELGFESSPGEGSAFWFELPVEVLGPEHDRREDAPLPMTIPRGSRGVRVMVVEDNAINQLLVRRQLERLGYDAVVFDTGTDAVEHFADTGASVILMDWQLPGIDGIETTRRIRAAEEEADLPRTPIVAMTASALPGDRDRCLAAGMDDFIAKPVSMVLLGDVIRRWAPDDPGHRPAGAAVAPRPALDAISWGRTGGWTASGAATPGADGAPDPDAPPGPPGEVRAAAGAASSGAIDLPALDRLVEDLTDRQLVASVVRTYLRELPPRLDAIERAVVARDGAGIEGAAHVLRSTSAAVGALRLAERCQDLERDPGAADAAAIESLRAEATAVHAELSTHLAALVATV